MGTKKKYIVLTLLFGFMSASALQAQSDLSISRAFNQYGKQKGVVLVNLTNEKFEGFDFTLYKSMTIKNNREALDLILKCLDEDEKKSVKTQKVCAEGIPYTTTMQLHSKVTSKGQILYRMILFKNDFLPKSAQTITLIYIESKNNSEDVINFILKKK